MVQATVKCTVQTATSFAERGAAGDGAALEAPTCARPVRVRAPEDFDADSWKSAHAAPEQAQLFTDLHRSDPQAVHEHVQGAAAMPEVGTELLGFRLIALLGKGAVAQVYLAQQGDLANRHVVVKVSPTIHQEMRTLAQLQHTNIVPVYSVRAAGLLQAVCMPYFGATTLADVLRELGTRSSLPQSGRDLISTIIGYKTTVRDVAAPSARSASASPAADASLPAPALPPSVGSTENLEILHGLSYVEAVLWLASRLADGLAHAHERGIVHRDLKPANILLTDEGQPMLLDFDLAHDTKRRGSTSITHIGGTLPYMAPEQIQALRAAAVFTDYRGDICSFGVILSELLTGRHPFPTHSGSVRHVLENMIQDRQAGPPPVRPFNKAVSPAVESIVRHCLEPDRKRRYQSVLQLKEDLDRHLEHRPLRYAPEPSLRERAAKWKRRHPRLASTTTVAALAGLVIVGWLGLVVVRGQRLAEIDARTSLNRFLDDKKTVQYLLTARTNDADQLDAGVKLCRAALDSYGLLDDPSWRQRSDVRRLSAVDQALL